MKKLYKVIEEMNIETIYTKAIIETLKELEFIDYASEFYTKNIDNETWIFRFMKDSFTEVSPKDVLEEMIRLLKPRAEHCPSEEKNLKLIIKINNLLEDGADFGEFDDVLHIEFADVYQLPMEFKIPQGINVESFMQKIHSVVENIAEENNIELTSDCWSTCTDSDIEI